MLSKIWNLVHAQLCYQIFITPLHFTLEKEYREFTRKACDFFKANRSYSIQVKTPRHHVIHCFEQANPNAKRILIAHGWISRAAYMSRLIRTLHQQGYQVYAIDFPAHGEAKGIQLTWIDAVRILRQTINNFGPFYGVIGHSFGGSMILNTLNLANQFSEWKLDKEPARVVLMASPTRMRTPVCKLARYFKLSGKGFIVLRKVFRQHTPTDLRHLDFRHFIQRSRIPVLCVHGEQDNSIIPYESKVFCEQYPHATLALLPGVDHVSVLLDEQVEATVCEFLA